jgi:hypothetical protein
MLKLEEEVADYLSYHIVECEKENKILVVQHYLFNRLIQKFDKETTGQRIYKTSGTSRFNHPHNSISHDLASMRTLCDLFSRNKRKSRSR